MAAMRATLNPGIWPLARILDSVRREDPAAEITVQNRLAKRRGACRMIVEQLDREGSLRAELEPTVAADLLWVLTSLRSWEDLVLVRGWTAAQYEEHILAALLRLLTNSPAPDGSDSSQLSDAVSARSRGRWRAPSASPSA
jgi:hypothetical protein